MNNNIDKQKIIDAIVSSSGGKINRESLAGAVNRKDVSSLLGSLSADDRQKLNSVLSNKESLAEALNSSEARNLIKSLLKGGGHNG